MNYSFLHMRMNLDKTVASIRDQVIHFDHIISQLGLLDPRPDIAREIDELVLFCCSTAISSVTFQYLMDTDPVFKASCKTLNRLLSQYEYQREKHWAKLYASDDHHLSLENFPDINDYRQSIRLEMDSLEKIGIRFVQSLRSNDECNNMVTKMVFIGSGPMPISSMLILNEYAPFTDIHNIDMSEEANQLASKACQQILPQHLARRIHFITHDMKQRPMPLELRSILKECQLIFIAALVGDNEDVKLQILRNILETLFEDTTKGRTQHIVIRTTTGLRQVLYPKIGVETITMLNQKMNDNQNDNFVGSLEIESIVHPGNDTRMSIIVIKKS